MKEGFRSGIRQMCSPEARQRCQQLHVAEITTNLQSAVTRCKLCTWYPLNQDCCYSLFLILGCCPFPTRCAHSPCWQMHSIVLLSVCRFGYSWGAQTWTFISWPRDWERNQLHIILPFYPWSFRNKSRCLNLFWMLLGGNNSKFEENPK